MRMQQRGVRHITVRLATAAMLAAAVTGEERTGGSPTALAQVVSVASLDNGCRLDSANNAMRHVIYVQFDNTHFVRDNPNVPSDLEQMPNLLSFMEHNGVVMTNHHTPLIAHTADDILTSETGLYPDRHGMPIANEYNYYKPDGTADTAGSFGYWTDPIVDYNTSSSQPVGDSTPTMVNPSGRNTQAPWVPYTRAGCNAGNDLIEPLATPL